MADIFKNGNCYFTGYLGNYHVRLPHRPDFWLWAAEGAPAKEVPFRNHTSVVRLLWLQVPWFQEFCIQQFRRSTGGYPWDL